MVLRAFVKSWIKYFSTPNSILMDLGREFDNSLFRLLGEKLGISLRVVGAGAHWPLVVERHHATLRKLVCMALQDDSSLSLEDALDSSQTVKNSLPMSNGMSPYFLVYGKNPKVPNFLEELDSQMGSLEPVADGRDLHEKYISDLVSHQ